MSLQIQLVEPRVSTPSKFLTKTYFLANFSAVMANEMVMHPNSPSGTLETRIPIAKTIDSIHEYPTPNLEAKKKTIANPTAI